MLKKFIKSKNMKPEIKFGIFFSSILLIIGIFFTLKGNNINIWFFAFSLFLYFVTFVFPKILIIPNKVWLGFGNILSKIFSPLILGLTFFLIITPIGIVLRLFKKDNLNQKMDKSKKSYWIKRKNSIGSMKNQY